MTENALTKTSASESPAVEARGFKALQELARHGYSPDPQPTAEDAGILLRHKSGPDLVLFPDGRIELPANQTVKSGSLSVPELRRHISWHRALLFVFLLSAYTLLSAVIIINVTAN